MKFIMSLHGEFLDIAQWTIWISPNVVGNDQNNVEQMLIVDGNFVFQQSYSVFSSPTEIYKFSLFQYASSITTHLIVLAFLQSSINQKRLLLMILYWILSNTIVTVKFSFTTRLTTKFNDPSLLSSNNMLGLLGTVTSSTFMTTKFKAESANCTAR